MARAMSSKGSNRDLRMAKTAVTAGKAAQGAVRGMAGAMVGSAMGSRPGPVQKAVTKGVAKILTAKPKGVGSVMGMASGAKKAPLPTVAPGPMAKKKIQQKSVFMK
jgi:hypothetical protein